MHTHTQTDTHLGHGVEVNHGVSERVGVGPEVGDKPQHGSVEGSVDLFQREGARIVHVDHWDMPQEPGVGVRERVEITLIRTAQL